MRRKIFPLIGALLLALVAAAVGADNAAHVFREDFEQITPPALPAGWLVVDQNGDGTMWTTREDGGDRGGNCARVLAPTVNPSDDWLFTSALNLETGKTYTLSFITRMTSAALPHNLEVRIGAAQSAAGMTATILPLTPFNNDQLVETSAGFTVASTGTWYIGFHCASLPGTLGFHLDTVCVSKAEPDLKVVLQMDKMFYDSSSTYSAGESMGCLIWVENNGTAPVKVNSLTCFGFETDPAFNFSLRITDPDALPLESTARFEEGVPAESDFITLAQDEMFHKFYDLNNAAWPFTKTGSYTIQAVYKNVFPSAAGDAWLGTLVSDPVVITVNP
ncbi:MAG TPA: choice-of-anchor J domain-containing protein [Candidatus Sumerlaeota bacterium]|nr:choice-of-anchor J domain-containing protein [Candidatus Sumerlaeota bacterium]